MLSNEIVSERAYIVGDMASLSAGMQAMELLIVRRAVTRHCAEDVLAQCAADLNVLTRRLRCIDAVAALHNA